jgi:hypothetical protein
MIVRPSSLLRLFAALLALGLLAATLVWRIPFMLWDHLDFAPIYAGWQNGALAQTIFFRVHGGHLHTAAYALLLATTWISHGQTWLDCLASWILLCLYALFVFAMLRDTLRLDDARTRASAALIVFLTLYPGHLANLQWGWQVAVFLCLFGVAAAIHFLTAASLTWKTHLLALSGAVLALLSFGTALALIPIAVWAIALRSEWSVSRRVGFMVPWFVVGVAAAWAMHGDAGSIVRHPQAGSVGVIGQAWGVARYALNYLGSGIARFATDLAPWLALLALFTGTAMAVAGRRQVEARPWTGLMLLGLLCAVLTALGRAGEGESQAFVSRYVSFSSTFWLGWVGLLAVTTRDTAKKPVATFAIAAIAVFALVNAVSMTRRAERLAGEAHAQATALCASWPNPDRSLLQGMHYDGADATRERLQVVRALGFAPFDRCTPAEGQTR